MTFSGRSFGPGFLLHIPITSAIWVSRVISIFAAVITFGSEIFLDVCVCVCAAGHDWLTSLSTASRSRARCRAVWRRTTQTACSRTRAWLVSDCFWSAGSLHSLQLSVDLCSFSLMDNSVFSHPRSYFGCCLYIIYEKIAPNKDGAEIWVHSSDQFSLARLSGYHLNWSVFNQCWIKVSELLILDKVSLFVPSPSSEHWCAQVSKKQMENNGEPSCNN